MVLQRLLGLVEGAAETRFHHGGQIVFDEKEAVKRIQKRKLEEKRQDDNEDVLKSRLKVYLNETKPLLDFYQKENKLNKINGMQTINDVNNQINDFILSLKNT